MTLEDTVKPTLNFNFNSHILLDNQAADHIFGNPQILTNLGPAPDSNFLGIGPSAIPSNQAGKFLNLVEVKLSKKSRANVLSIPTLRDAGFDCGEDKPNDTYYWTLPNGYRLVFPRVGKHYALDYNTIPTHIRQQPTIAYTAIKKVLKDASTQAELPTQDLPQSPPEPETETEKGPPTHPDTEINDTLHQDLSHGSTDNQIYISTTETLSLKPLRQVWSPGVSKKGVQYTTQSSLALPDKVQKLVTLPDTMDAAYDPGPKTMFSQLPYKVNKIKNKYKIYTTNVSSNVSRANQVSAR
jgi:hypothetical protein